MIGLFVAAAPIVVAMIVAVIAAVEFTRPNSR